MKLSYNWLNDYIDLSSLPVQELADILTMKTCEVEGIEAFYEFLQSVPVVEVREVKPHPDADKLVVCQVYNGHETLQIVTGASNVVAGKKYAHAAIGVTLPNGMTMQKAKLRGLDSYGMLCSAEELGMKDFMLTADGQPEKGLMTLPDDVQPGDNLRQALGLADYIIDIDNKSITHRPDLWSHFGFARELSAILKKPLLKNPLQAQFASDSSLNIGLPAISIEGKAALGYSGAVLAGFEVKPSPLALQARLVAVGLRPINNVVDASNYVLCDIGQPNHAFDRAQLPGQISVSFSKAGEKISTLDERELTLPGQIVLIRSQNQPVALAGVMGGKDSSVSSQTRELFLESASFHREDIRRAVSRLGIRSDSSQRFEKGQDPAKMTAALHLFARVLAKSCPALKMSETRSQFSEEPRSNQIDTSFAYIRSRLGNIALSDQEISDLLGRLGMVCQTFGDQLKVQVPGYRSYYDITMPDDLVEEIGRMVGYVQIEPGPLMVRCEVPAQPNKMRELEHELRNLFARSFHFSEVYNYAFHSEKDVQSDLRYAPAAMAMQNAIHQELSFLRISPLPGLLKNIEKSWREQSDLRFFEVERIFVPPANQKNDGSEASLPIERHFLAGAMVSSDKDEAVMTTLSSMLSHLLDNLGLPYAKQNWLVLKEDVFHPGRAGQICQADGKPLIKWGQVHPRLSAALAIDKPVFYFEAFLEDLLALAAHKSWYHAVARFPATDFEMTLLLPRKMPFAEVVKVIGREQMPQAGSEQTIIESVEHITTYTGEPIAADQKAVSIRVVWRNYSRTLASDEIKSLQADLLARLEKANLALRK